MQSIQDAARNAATKAEQIAEQRRNTTPAERIARGVAQFGWTPSATCDRCGDTGKYPLSGQFCEECPEGQRKREQDESDRQANELVRRWVMTGVPRRFAGYRLDTSPCSPAVIERVRRWIAADPCANGAGLILTGGVGAGKTGVAIGALWEFHVAAGGDLQFISTTALLDALKPESGEDDVLRSLQKATVLVLDDLGTTRGTEWERDRLFALLNARYENQRPTITTSNLKIADLAKSVGERSVSRLVEGATIVAVDGDDFRMRGAK